MTDVEIVFWAGLWGLVFVMGGGLIVEYLDERRHRRRQQGRLRMGRVHQIEALIRRKCPYCQVELDRYGRPASGLEHGYHCAYRRYES